MKSRWLCTLDRWLWGNSHNVETQSCHHILFFVSVETIDLSLEQIDFIQLYTQRSVVPFETPYQTRPTSSAFLKEYESCFSPMSYLSVPCR